MCPSIRTDAPAQSPPGLDPPLRRRTVLTAAGLTAVGAAVASTVTRARAATADSSQQLAGQRVIHSYSGLTPPQALLNTIAAGGTAGVIFFGDNISSETQIASVIDQLNEANADSPTGLPLLLMTDQEGGQIRRLPGAPTMSEKQIGASSNPVGNATAAGTGAGQNLAGVGMNLNLAPVLDVYRTAGDFDDQYGRSYSTSASVCGSCGAAFISAQQATGVAATAKHFPGLGSATSSQNTDNGPVTLSASASTLRSVDEAPYVNAISAGVKLVMVSWAVYTGLDASHPAGLSSTIVTGELRNRLGFTGVTVTDALSAGALSSYGGTGNRAVLAAGAGMDLILCSSGSPSEGDAAVTALGNALDAGTLNATAFSAAANRVSSLRSTLA